MSTEMVVNVSPRETRAALLENGILQELFVERASRRGLAGNLMLSLQGELFAAMKSGGPVVAVDVCRVKAPQIATATATGTPWKIARTALKVRNPRNAPDAWETAKLEEFKPYRPVEMVAELARTMRRELEFGREERNLTQFAGMFEHDTHVHVPAAITPFCTSRVLTMEYLEGIKVSDTSRLAAAGVDIEGVARRLAEMYLRMIFQEGFFHADPHPGNILVLRGEVIE